jgi:hypothetical protein
MSEINNISVESIETSKSTERDLPIDSYIERLNSELKEFSSTMYVDTEALTNEPEGGESWDKIEHYLKCIRISEEQPKSITLPYWGSVRLPTPEELAEPDTEEYTPEDVLGRLFVVNAALNVEFNYYNKETFKEEVMTLGQLISEVYPGLQGGVKEIRKELEFAFRNPEGFKKKFSEKERLVGGLTRRAFIKKGVEATAASLFILTSMTLASCSGKQVQTEPTPIVETYTPVVPIETEEATPTPTETQEPTPTPTETQELSPTPTQTETPEPTTTPTRLPESEDPEVRGYYISDVYDEKTGTERSLLEVYSAKIESVEITNNGIQVDLLMDFYNIKKSISIETDEFIYLEVDPQTYDTITQVTVDKDIDINKLIDLNREYNIGLTIKDIPKFKSNLIEQFINGEVDLEFDLHDVVWGL